MATIIEMLNQDHTHLCELADRAQAAQRPEDARDLTERLRQELLIHCRFEDENILPAVAGRERVRGEVQDARDDHNDIKALMGDLSRAEPGSEMWHHDIDQLRRMLAAHFAYEQEHIFTLMARDLDPITLEAMAIRYANSRQAERLPLAAE